MVSVVFDLPSEPASIDKYDVDVSAGNLPFANGPVLALSQPVTSVVISPEASVVQSGDDYGHFYSVCALTSEQQLSKVTKARYRIIKLILQVIETSF